MFVYFIESWGLYLSFIKVMKRIEEKNLKIYIYKHSLISFLLLLVFLLYALFLAHTQMQPIYLSYKSPFTPPPPKKQAQSTPRFLFYPSPLSTTTTSTASELPVHPILHHRHRPPHQCFNCQRQGLLPWLPCFGHEQKCERGA